MATVTFFRISLSNNKLEIYMEVTMEVTYHVAVRIRHITVKKAYQNCQKLIFIIT